MHGQGHHETALFDIGSLPRYMQMMVTLSAIGLIFFVGKFISRPLFRTIAATRVRDIFVAAARDRDSENEAPDADTINHSGQKVILAGFGRMGTDLGRFLLSAGIKPVIIDHDPANAADRSAAYALMDAGVSTIHRENEELYISMYQNQNADLEELMALDMKSDMEDLDQAWTAANPET